MPRRDGFDVVVVGGGAAGCVVASRLAAPGDRSVLLLEAGPDMRRHAAPEWHDGWRLPTVPDWGFAAEPADGAEGARLRRGRVLGGTSWLTRFAIRGAASDFDGWAALGNPGWAWADVLPVFRRIETDAEFGTQPWHGDQGPIGITRYPDHEPSPIHAAAREACLAVGFGPVADHNAPGAIGVGAMPMSSRAGRRETTVDAYLTPARVAGSMSVRCDSQVATVILERDRAAGVTLVDGTVVVADQVILAAGTYGSPPILMRSGIGPADHLGSMGIATVVDLPGVGSNLADHPAVDLDSGWRGSGTSGPILQTIATYASSGAPTRGAPDMMFWFGDPEDDDPGFYLDPILLKPQSRGTVRLRSADPTAAPRITLPGVRTESDIDRLAEGYLRGVELANRPEIVRRSEGSPPAAPGSAAACRRVVIENQYSIPHVVGTCAMGPSAAGGAVVDHAGAVHGVLGLHVIDASIIPDAPSGFPYLVTIMLADHLADRLVGASNAGDRWKSSPDDVDHRARED